MMITVADGFDGPPANLSEIHLVGDQAIQSITLSSSLGPHQKFNNTATLWKYQNQTVSNYPSEWLFLRLGGILMYH